MTTGQIRAECAAVLALPDDELESLADQAFAGRPGLRGNWLAMGRGSGLCIEHLARHRIRLRRLENEERRTASWS